MSPTLSRRKGRIETEELEGPDVAPEAPLEEESQTSTNYFSDDPWFDEADLDKIALNSVTGSVLPMESDPENASKAPVASTQDDDLFDQFEVPVFPPTQPANEDPPSEYSGLGKRKTNETELSSTSTIVAEEPATKKAKPAPTKPRGGGKPSRASAANSGSASSSKPRQSSATTATSEKRKKLPEPFIAAYDKDVADKLKKSRIPFGAQLQLARLITHEQLMMSELKKKLPDLTQLRGMKNLAAVQYLEKLFPDPEIASRSSTRSPWTELDEEIHKWEMDEYSGVGTDFGWYGGKVTLRATFDAKTKKFTVDTPTLDTSSALKRRFGSHNILRVTTNDNSVETLEFFLRPIVIWGMVFRSLHASQDQGSSHVTMVCVNQQWANGEFKKQGLTRLGTGKSLMDIVKLLNDPEVNKQQFIGKWASRFALYESSSIPGPPIRQCDIHEQEDVYSLPTDGRDPSNMTDGCGVSNWATHRAYRDRFGEQVSAIQFRCRGAKGMTLCIHDTEWGDEKSIDAADARPKLWLRDSQMKIRFPDAPLDPIHLSMAVLHHSEIRTPIRLSPEVIINLESNGVPSIYFEDLAKICVDSIVANFTTIHDDDGLFLLWQEVNKAEGIGLMREARASRIVDRSMLQKDNDANDGGTYPLDRYSGCPTSLGEKVMELLDSGFSPKESVYLSTLVRRVAKSELDRKKVDYHFPVEKSCSGYVVPDPYGVLAEGEIQVLASSPRFVDGVGRNTSWLLGDVVMTRNPCKIPTDARKFKATTHPRLASMTDVIVCSVKGDIRLLDMLAGGDYDGDKGTVFWDPEIVDHDKFRDADLKYMTPPPEVDAMFEQDKTSVSRFLNSTASLPEAQRVVEIQRHLLGELESGSNVGRISTQHDHCIYVTGDYTHHDCVMVGHMFARVMDAKKSGERFIGNLDDHLTNPLCKHPQIPPWNQKAAKDKDKDNAKAATNNTREVQRDHRARASVMDKIQRAMNKAYTAGMKTFDEVLPHKKTAKGKSMENDRDPVLVARWREESSKDVYSHDCALLKAHVDAVQARWSCVWKESNQSTLQVKLTEETACSRDFNSFNLASLKFLPSADVPTVLASCAYATHSDGFAFRVAWSELCKLKAGRDAKAVTRRFYDRSKLNTKSLQKKVLA